MKIGIKYYTTFIYNKLVNTIMVKCKRTHFIFTSIFPNNLEDRIKLLLAL